MKKKIKQTLSGFTLIETLFATMMIGLVIVAIAIASTASTMVNSVSIDLSTAEFLTEEIRERTATVSFANLFSYNGDTYNPPIDITGAAMNEFSAFSQEVTAEYVTASSLDSASATATDFIRVTVTITKNGGLVSSSSWIRANL